MILITEAHPKNLRIIRFILDIYAKMSGLHVNLTKSTFIPIAVREEHIHVLSAFHDQKT